MKSKGKFVKNFKFLILKLNIKKERKKERNEPTLVSLSNHWPWELKWKKGAWEMGKSKEIEWTGLVRKDQEIL